MTKALSLLLALSLFACVGDDDSSSDPAPNSAVTGSGTVSAKADEGSSTTGATSVKNPWLGTWALGGTQSTTCGAASGTTQLNGVAIVTSDSDGKIATKYSSTCTLTWTVKDHTATMDKDQVCTVAINDVNVTVKFDAATMNLNGNIMTGLLSGSSTNGCSFTQQETLTLM